MARGAMEYGMANALDLGEVMAEAAKWSEGRWELVSVTPTRMEADKLGVMRAREYLLMFKREKRDG